MRETLQGVDVIRESEDRLHRVVYTALLTVGFGTMCIRWHQTNEIRRSRRHKWERDTDSSIPWQPVPPSVVADVRAWFVERIDEMLEDV